MRCTILLLSGVILAVSADRTVVAQTFPVPRGTRVRVTTTTSEKPVIGVVEAVSDTSVRITHQRDTTRILVRTIRGVEVSTARTRPMWSKTAPLWLTAAGAATGAVLGHETAPSTGGPFSSPEDSALMGAVAGGILGLVVGTVIAVAVVHETWEPVVAGVSERSSTAPGLYVAPRRSGISVGLRAAF